jgi:2-dehydro-3-deoxygluconokinase
MIPRRSVVAIGEAMLEMAPVGGGLYAKAFAGDTFNTVWHMAQLLGSNAAVGYVTRVGQDKLSDAFVGELTADGLGIAGISRDSDRTMGLYLIALDGVERGFHYWRGNSAATALADDRVVLEMAVGQAGLIHVSGITLAILSPHARTTLFDVLARARKAGAVISFDPNIRPRLWSSIDEIRETVLAMLAVTDIALPSFDDEATHWGDATHHATLARFAAAGVGEVVVKDGAGAVVFRADGQDGSVASPPVPHIKDTTGAGDAFNAGYLAARLMGQPAQQAIGMGHQMAAVVLGSFGARADKARVKALAGLL